MHCTVVPGSVVPVYVSAVCTSSVVAEACVTGGKVSELGGKLSVVVMAIVRVKVSGG